MGFSGTQTETNIEYMLDRNRSEEDLTAEVERLRSQLADRDRSEGLYRAREDAYRKLLGHADRNGFLFDIEVTEATPDQPSELSIREADIYFLSPDRVRAKAQRVVESGRGVWYRELHGSGDAQRWWRVHLVPTKDGTGHVRSILGRAWEGSGQRATAKRIQKSDRLFQNLFELLPDAVIITNAAGRLLHINSAGLRLLGAEDASELLGQAVWDMMLPEDVLRARERGRLIHRGEKVDLIEHTLVRLDGSTVPIETLSVPVRYGGKRAFLSTARDISGRKRLEDALSESRELFYKAFQAGPAGYIITRISDGLILDVNDEYVRLTGYMRDELVGKRTAEVGIVDDPGARKDIIQDLETEGALYKRIFEIRRKNGEVRKVLGSIQRVEVQDEYCMLVVVVDVTDREQASMAERQSRDLLDRVFHASPAAICILRQADGRFIDVNDQFCNLTGYNSDEVVGNTTAEIDLWGAEESAPVVKRRLREEQTVQDHEAELRTKVGEKRTVLVSSQRTQVRGEPCLLIVLVDITERKHVEMELIRSKERAEEMSRIKTAFLTNMTHEVRTPLTVILGFTSMLRQGVRDEYQRFVRVIERSGRRLLLMLDSILDLAQLEAGTISVEQQVFNVSDVVQNEADIFQQVAEEKGLRLEVQLPGERAHARADHKIFVRVLNNLFDNAVKFTEEGKITLRVEPKVETVDVVVEDTGVGIDVAFLPRVFDEFSQESTGLERTHQGSGLGLAVSRRLLELMGGSIQVESKKGQGSRFTITVPRVQSRG